MRYVVVGGLATEELSGELLLCDASGTAVHRIAGDARRYFERVAGGDGELPDDQVTAALVAANAIVPVDVTAASLGTDGMSRRKVMALGAAAAAAAGVVTVGLPSAAAAQSPGPGPAPEEPVSPPVAPDEPEPGGASPVDGALRGSSESDRGAATQTTFAFWFNPAVPFGFGDPVTYAYKLYSPVAGGNGVLIADGVATGQSPTSSVSVPIGGQAFRWLLVPVGGGLVTVDGTFPRAS